MELCTAGSLDKNFILNLYQKSFPERLREPYSLIERKAAVGTMEVLVIREDGQRIGFAITAATEDLVLLDYFAVSPEYRNMGYGAETLLLLKELYSDKILFLGLVKAGQETEKHFYLKCGLTETGICINLHGVKEELLAARPGLTFKACERLYRMLYGPMYREIVSQVTS